MVKSQAHSASASCKKKKRVQGFFIVYYSCCCCLIQASLTTLIALPRAPFSAAPPPVWYSITTVLFYFSKEVRKRAFRFISSLEYFKWVSVFVDCARTRCFKCCGRQPWTSCGLLIIWENKILFMALLGQINNCLPAVDLYFTYTFTDIIISNMALNNSSEMSFIWDVLLKDRETSS